jgi:hypothetical protein
VPTQRYALEPGGPKRVEVSWGAFFRNCTIRVDGNVIGVVPGQQELKAGSDFRLMDGSTLRVQLVRGLLSQEVRVLRDGFPLPGSASDPAQRLKTAYGILFFLGALNVLLGLVAEVAQVDFLLAIGVGVGSIVEGAIFLILGYFVRQRSLVALVLAVALLGLDTLFALVEMASGSGALVGGLLVRVIFLVYVIRGFDALRSLRATRAPA